METRRIDPEIIPFSLKTREMCKNCKRYNTKATCPPYVETVEYYESFMTKYKNVYIYYEKFDKTDDWKQLGKDSSLKIHHALLDVRDKLFSEGHYFISIFGAGSCKMCDKCTFPCRFPTKGIIPLEATGVNVVQLMALYNVKITFPITDTMYRIGMVLYD